MEFTGPFVLMLLFNSSSVFAQTSPSSSRLCTELAAYSCAPGAYKDATGVVKSSAEMQDFFSAYARKSVEGLKARFAKVLADPRMASFQELATAALGLKPSPQCASKSAVDRQACRNNVVEGLTALAQKQTLSALVAPAGLQRLGSLREMDAILKNQTYLRIVEDFNQQAQKDFSNPTVEKKIKEKVLPGVQAQIEKRIRQLSIPEPQKKALIDKVRAVQFGGTDCRDISKVAEDRVRQGDAISVLVLPNAFLDPSRSVPVLKYCTGALLQSTSEFEMAWIIAHELSHSIDPCTADIDSDGNPGFLYKKADDWAQMEAEFPFKNVLSCLRGSKSIEAKPKTSDYIPFSVENSTVEKTPLSFCGGDPIREGFADWLSFEVLPSYMQENYKLTPEQYREGYANAMRVSCRVDAGRAETSHPGIERRIHRLLLVQPKIRAQMDCNKVLPETQYCDTEVHSGVSPSGGAATQDRGANEGAAGAR